MTIATPIQAIAPPPEATVLLDEDVLRVAVVDDVTVAWSAGGVVRLDAWETDALLSASDGLEWFFLAEGSSFTGPEAVWAVATCTFEALTLSWTGGVLEGAADRGEEACGLEVAWPGGAPTEVQVDGVVVSDWGWAEGSLSLAVSNWTT